MLLAILLPEKVLGHAFLFQFLSHPEIVGIDETVLTRCPAARIQQASESAFIQIIGQWPAATGLLGTLEMLNYRGRIQYSGNAGSPDSSAQLQT